MRRLGFFVVAAILFPLSTLAQPRTVETPSGRVQVETVADGLVHPWALAFLPDGRMLVTERPGRLRIVSKDGKLSEPLGGLPRMFTEGQGGLLDVALSPDFASDRLVYFSFSEPGEGGSAGTAVGRGRLTEDRLENVEVIFRQEPKVEGPNHFGSRLAFSPDGKLFVTMGERFKFQPAQDVSNHLGTVARINRDGSVPQDNPFVGQDARPEIWSFGHRNVEGAAVHPETGALWIHEMGPRGGDELNIPEAGRNYGWPVVSWGRHYDGRDIPDPPTRPEFARSVKHWTPVISPSGMTFYTGDLFPEWKGSVLIGGLTAKGVVRVTLDARQATGEERVDLGQRIRDVRQGPDGAVYVLTDEDSGEILRLSPAKRG
jgi:glucose/arabinose dehydrogenase